MDFDVIVCGAGPAGANAAYHLARAGLKVCILEKEKLPRHKTCGGGMPMVVSNYLKDLEPKAFLEADIKYMRHTWNFGDPVLAPINQDKNKEEITLWMVQRSIFDNALTERAKKAGAKLFEETTLTGIEPNGDKVKVYAKEAKNKSGELTLTAKYLIGADGANGPTARLTGLRKNRVLAYAMEVEHPYDFLSGHPDLRRDIIHLEYGAVSGGYAWIFPKKNHLNVGAGIFAPYSSIINKKINKKELLRNTIFKYLEHLKVSYRPELMTFYAHPLPLWNGKEILQTQESKVLLVGDAAGLINPLFGDGILHAIKSGGIAANCIISGTTKDFTTLIQREFAPCHDAALALAPSFYKFASFIYKFVVKRSSASRVAAELLCGYTLFTSVKEKTIGRLSTLIPGFSSS